MAEDAAHSERTLSSADQIRARPGEFGADLENLFDLPGLTELPQTLAWGGSVFKREIDAQQADDLDLHALLRRGPKHLDARRVRQARENALTIAQASQRLAELQQLANQWSAHANDRVMVWTSLVGSKHVRVEPGFRALVPPRHEELAHAASAAWASAYELRLLEDLAQHSIRRFTLALAFSFLPQYRARSQFFLLPSQASEGESVTILQGRHPDEAGTGFDAASGATSADEAGKRMLVRDTAAALSAALPTGGYVEFCLTNDALCVTGVRRVVQGPARWLAWDGEFGAASTHFGRSLLWHFERRVARPVLDQVGVRSRRQFPWLGTVEGRPYLNLSSLQLVADALDASPALLSALTGEHPQPLTMARDQRFRAPRLLAELALLDSRLRSRVRELQAQSLRHVRWFEELDLAILPDDALPTTLRETRQFMDTAGGLYLETELALVRALSGLADLGSEGGRLDPTDLFPTLTVEDELASVAHCEDFAAAVAALHSDQNALAKVRSGAGGVFELPDGRAKQELSYYFRHHGFWTNSRVSGATNGSEDEHELLETMLGVTPLPGHERAQRRRASVALRQASTQLLAGANGWLGRQALNTMLERVASFARMHETLRVTLARSYALLRHVSLDAGRRLARLNPMLEPEAVWHLSFDELCSAVQYADTTLSPLVEERARCHQQRQQRPAPGRRLPELESLPSTPSLASRMPGAPTATGTFLGRIRRLASVSTSQPVGLEDVLVAPSFAAGKSLLVAHAGAIVSGSGGPLSHAAFVARQLGVPAVLGLGESIDALKDGDEVLVDGKEGVVLRTMGGVARR